MSTSTDNVTTPVDHANAAPTPGDEQRPTASPEPVEGNNRQISDRQLAANRANAQKSTGPRTHEGKTRSAQNATTHNLSSTNLNPDTLVPEPDRQDYIAFAHDLRQNLEPQAPLAELLVQRIALLGYKLRLHAQAEARRLDQASARARNKVE